MSKMHMSWENQGEDQPKQRTELDEHSFQMQQHHHQMRSRRRRQEGKPVRNKKRRE